MGIINYIDGIIIILCRVQEPVFKTVFCCYIQFKQSIHPTIQSSSWVSSLKLLSSIILLVSSSFARACFAALRWAFVTVGAPLCTKVCSAQHTVCRICLCFFLQWVLLCVCRAEQQKMRSQLAAQIMPFFLLIARVLTFRTKSTIF